MKEKTLIISNNKRIVKKLMIILIISIVLFLTSLISFCWADSYQHKAASSYDSCHNLEQSLKNFLGNYYNEKDYIEKDCFKIAQEEYPLWGASETPRTLGIIGLFFFTPTTLLFLILFFLSNKMELTITDKRVYGKSVFGKRVDLPVDSISAISKNLIFGITVSTSSGNIRWYMIDDKEKVYNTLESLIIKRQDNGKNSKLNVGVTDELKKYKELLDSGAISQEEFEAKKKQLLDL